MATIEITAENLADTIEEGITLLDFWAAWCGPCRQFGPVFEDASNRHADIKFGKVDTEAQQDLARQFNIMSIPTVMIFRDGVKLFEGAGALDKSSLDDLIAQAEKLDMDEVRAQLAQDEQ